MNTFTSMVGKYLVQKTSWLFLVLLLFLSYLLCVSVVDMGWYNFVSIYCRLCIIFSPIILFSIVRDFFSERIQKYILRIFWILSFILIPILIFVFRTDLIQFVIKQDQYNTTNIDITGEFSLGFLLTTIASVIITELAIIFQKRILNNMKQKSWRGKISIDQMIFIAFAVLAFLLAIKGVVEQYRQLGNIDFIAIIKLSGKLLIYFFQYMLITSIYYFYYYINKNYLIPQIMRKAGVIQYFFSVAGVILIFYPIFNTMVRMLPIVAELDITNYSNSNFIFSSDGGAGPFIIIIMSLPIIISNEWFFQNNQITNLEKEKSNAELTLLKNQINPHFFFNTLNNLYAMSITNDKETPEVILQLSELMRYVIYRGKEELVPLQDEIKYIEDYIQLQRIRLHKSMDFQFQKNVTNPHLMVPPLLFITFVENSFKHGIENAEGPTTLYLELRSDNDELFFSCSNSFEPCEDFDPGIGLGNFRRRLDLRYPNSHKIEISEMENMYTASIHIRF